MVSVGKSKVILFKYLLMLGNKCKAHKMTAKESIYFTKNQIQGSVRFVQSTIYGTLAHPTTCANDLKDKKNESIGDQWKGSNTRTRRLGHLLLRRILSVALA